MSAPKGNQFWKARSKHGRDKIFSNKDVLLESCYEYFQWVEDNPLYEDRLVSYMGESRHEPVAKMRAMTLAGLCVFLNIDFDTWKLYKNRDEFSDAVGMVEKIIYTQKFSGAAADLLNANIISRDLGLADKSEQSGVMQVNIVKYADDSDT